MNNIERRDRQMLYISDDRVFEEQKKCRALLQKLNFMDRADFDGITALVKELLGTSDGAFINPPFYCDYGFNIEVGEDFFANTNMVILDEARVTFGDHVFIGPNCSFYTPCHPIDAESRNAGKQWSLPIKVGNNVWLGGNVTVCPGVTIGDGTVIGAGSVVTHDIPAGVLAAGNPCRVIKTI